ncbi:hypothetical protein QUF58_13020 [Anaerolineales bacterium HSG24]|nr:hypothetical protein [Anaerolineales bacterium HSG24]
MLSKDHFSMITRVSLGLLSLVVLMVAAFTISIVSPVTWGEFPPNLPLHFEAKIAHAQGGITLTKTASLNVVNQNPTMPDHEIVYEIILQNGPITYTSTITDQMVLRDVLPAGTSCVNSSSTNDSVDWAENNYICLSQGVSVHTLLPNRQLSPNEVVKFTYSVVPTTTDQATLVNDLVTLTGGTPDVYINQPFNVQTLVNAPEWTISKSANVNTAQSGDQITYQITVRNTGSVPTFGSFQITEQLPNNTTYIPTANGGTLVGTTVTWDFNQVLNVGQSVDVDFTVQVDAGLNNGDKIVNSTYCVSGGYVPGQTCGAPVTATIFAPVNIILQKTASPTPEVAVGGLLTYRLTLENDPTSGSNVVGLFVSDVVPDNTDYESHRFISGQDPNLDQAYFDASLDIAIWVINSPVDSGDTVIMELVVRVDDNLANGDVIENSTHEIRPLPGTPPFTMNPAPQPVTTGIRGPTSLDISKTTTRTIVLPTEQIIYTINITNDSTADATSGTITEVVPQNTTWDSAGSTAGWSCPSIHAGTTCTYDFGNLAADSPTSATFAVRVNPVVSDEVDEIINTAIINYSSANGIPPDLSDNRDTHHLDLAVPGVTLLPSLQEGFAQPGNVLTYSLDVINTGTTDETILITVTNGLFVASPQTMSFSLVGGERREVIFSISIPATAEVGYRDTTGILAALESNDNLSDIATFVTTVAIPPNLGIVKGFYPSARAGEVITYGLVYINQVPNSVATGVVITETLPHFTTYVGDPNLWQQIPGTRKYRHEVGTLSFEGNSIIFPVKIDDNLPVFTVFDNIAEIGDDGTHGPEEIIIDNNSMVTTVITDGTTSPPTGNGPDMRIYTTASSGSFGPGDQISYSFMFANMGTAIANGVTIRDTLPDHTHFVEGTPTWRPVGSEYWYDVPSLLISNGPSYIVTMTVQVDDNLPGNVTVITNSAIIVDNGHNGADLNLADNSTVFTNSINNPNAPNLTLTKTDNNVSVEPGDTLVYTVNYGNSGPGIASGVLIQEVVPANSTFNATASLSGWDCTDGAAAEEICRHNVGTLSSGASGVVQFAVTVNQNLPSSVTSIGNIATIIDSLGNVDSAVKDTLVINNNTASTLTLTKTDNNVIVEPGDTLVYTLNYGNGGSNTVSGVLLSEVVPANSTFNATASSSGWDCMHGAVAKSVCRYNVGTLNSGESRPILFAVTINHNLPSYVTSIGNIATIIDSLGNVDSAVEDTLINRAFYLPLIIKPAPIDLWVEQVDVSDLSPFPGQPVVITVTVRNNQGTAVPKSFWVDLYLSIDPITPQVNQSWSSFGLSRVPYGVVWRTYDTPNGQRLLTNLIPNDPFDPTHNYSNFIPKNIGTWDKTMGGYPINNHFREPGQYYLYVLVDSFAESGSSLGEVVERNEQNNLYGPLIITVPGTPKRDRSPARDVLELHYNGGRPSLGP